VGANGSTSIIVPVGAKSCTAYVAGPGAYGAGNAYGGGYAAGAFAISGPVITLHVAPGAPSGQTDDTSYITYNGKIILSANGTRDSSVMRIDTPQLPLPASWVSGYIKLVYSTEPLPSISAFTVTTAATNTAGSALITCSPQPAINFPFSQIVTYTVSSGLGTGSSPITVNGLVPWRSYPITVTASNGVSSLTSSAVTLQLKPAPVISSVTATPGVASCAVSCVFESAEETASISKIVVVATPANASSSTGTYNAQTTSFTGLTPFETYTFAATATNATGSTSATSNSVVILGAPYTPIVVATPDNGTIAVSWSFTQTGSLLTAMNNSITQTAVTAVYSTDARNGNKSGLPAPGSFAAGRYSGLTPNAYYDVTVTLTGNGTSSSTVSHVYIEGAPSAPTIGTITTAPNNVTLTYTRPPVASNTVLDYGVTVTDEAGIAKYAFFNGLTATLPVPGVGKNTVSIYARSFAGAGTVATSTFTYTAYPYNNPPAIQNLVATYTMGKNYVDLSWSFGSIDEAASITAINASGPSAGGTFRLNNSNRIKATSGVFTGLVSSYSQTFTLTATNAAGSATASSNTIDDVRMPPLPPNLDYPRKASGYQADNINNVNLVDSNRCEIPYSLSTDGGSVITSISASSNPPGASASKTQGVGPDNLLVGPLQKNVIYTITLNASNQYGTGVASAPSASVAYMVLCNPPSIISATSTSTGFILDYMYSEPSDILSISAQTVKVADMQGNILQTVAVPGAPLSGTLCHVPITMTSAPPGGYKLSIAATNLLGTGAYSTMNAIWIPANSTTIPANAFKDYTSLFNVTIPQGVTSIGENAFSGCTSLTTVNIPGPVTSIGASAFSGCTSLSSINLPAGVALVGANAFNGSGITRVIIPASVTKIGTQAFSNCTSLTSIAFVGRVPVIEAGVFQGSSPTSLNSIIFGVGFNNISYYTFQNAFASPSHILLLSDVASFYNGATISYYDPNIMVPTINTTAVSLATVTNTPIDWSLYASTTTAVQQAYALTNYTGAFKNLPSAAAQACIKGVLNANSQLNAQSSSASVAAVLYAASSNPTRYTNLATPTNTVGVPITTSLGGADGAAFVAAISALPGRTFGTITLPLAVARPLVNTLPEPPTTGTYFLAIDKSINSTYTFANSRDTLSVAGGVETFNSFTLGSKILNLGSSYVFTNNSGATTTLRVSYQGSTASNVASLDPSAVTDSSINWSDYAAITIEYQQKIALINYFAAFYNIDWNTYMISVSPTAAQKTTLLETYALTTPITKFTNIDWAAFAEVATLEQQYTALQQSLTTFTNIDWSRFIVSTSSTQQNAALKESVTRFNNVDWSTYYNAVTLAEAGAMLKENITPFINLPEIAVQATIIEMGDLDLANAVAGSVNWLKYASVATVAHQAAALTHSAAFTNLPNTNTQNLIFNAAAIEIFTVPLTSSATAADIGAVLFAAYSKPRCYTLLPVTTDTNGTPITRSFAEEAFILALQATGKTTGTISLPIALAVPYDNLLPAPPVTGSYFATVDKTINATYTYVGSEDTLVVAGGVETFYSSIAGVNPVVLSRGAQYIFTPTSGQSVALTVNYAGGDLSTASASPPCFLYDAPVLTLSGYRAIGDLRVGDLVVSPGGPIAIKAIKKELAAPNDDSYPYVIPEGLYGATQRLLISPHHQVLVSPGVYKEARFLNLEREVMSAPWDYYNVELVDNSADMIVAGVVVETWKLWDGVERFP